MGATFFPRGPPDPAAPGCTNALDPEGGDLLVIEGNNSNQNTIMQTHTIAFFSPVRYDSIYQRPQTLFDKLADHGHRVYYFQGPYKKGSLNHSRFSYRYPPAIQHLTETKKIVTLSRYFDFFGLSLRFTKACMDRHVSRWLHGFMNECMGGRVI
ncbi:MAG: hypothetical protein KJ645_01225, partial [Planctomycetes bacterium]|nr:hypothetical protein [Planctomycetota bacterium]